MIVNETVPAALSGQRLDRIVAMITGCSRAQAAQWIDDGRVIVNGNMQRGRSIRLVAGAELEIEQPDTSDDRPLGDASVNFGVVHVDDDVIVVDKPAGLVVHPGAGHHDATLVNGLLARFPEIVGVGQTMRPGIVHRLDQGTSGLMVVARTSTAYESLVSALAQRHVHREYITLVHGHPEALHGVIDAPIGRSQRDPTLMAITQRGKDARTHYEVLERFMEPIVCATLKCVLETGRTHQIRVHLSAIGHGVVGDVRYGGSAASLPIERPFLHARSLAFVHPISGEELAFAAELPADLATALQSLSA